MTTLRRVDLTKGCQHEKPKRRKWCDSCQIELLLARDKLRRMSMVYEHREFQWDTSELMHCSRCDRRRVYFTRRFCDKCEDERSKAYRHGLTLGQAEDLLESQGGKCAICQKRLWLQDGYVDHDHACCPDGPSCGKCVRGIVDARCNTLLGYLETTPRDVLDRAFEYIKPRLRAVA